MTPWIEDVCCLLSNFCRRGHKFHSLDASRTVKPDRWTHLDTPDGAAMLVGSTPDVLFLAVRLRSNQQRLAASIIGQFERDVSLLPVN